MKEILKNRLTEKELNQRLEIFGEFEHQAELIQKLNK